MKRLYHIMDLWSQVMEMGATPPVDSFPLLRHVPERLLGNWKSRSRRVGIAMESLYSDVLDQVEARRKGGRKVESFIDYVLDQNEKNQLSRNQLIFLGGVVMEGGSDTSSSIIIAIIQGLIKNPEIQKKAHAQIDAVVGEDRSPVWADFEKLPYINCIVKEGHRWRPVTPLSFPHALGQGILNLSISHDEMLM